MSDMTDKEFDAALIAAAFALAARSGWRGFTVAAAAREAGLPLSRARARFPGRGAILMRFGSLADQAALAEPVEKNAPPRDRIFDVVMRRIDALQAHREGVIAVLRRLPVDPALALLLGAATLRSMGWMLEGAGVPASGLRGRLRAKGLLAVWLWTLRAWERDDSPDLSGTMAALDKALGRAEQAADWLERGSSPPATDTAPVDDAAGDAPFTPPAPPEPPDESPGPPFPPPPPEPPASPPL